MSKVPLFWLARLRIAYRAIARHDPRENVVRQHRGRIVVVLRTRDDTAASSAHPAGRRRKSPPASANPRSGFSGPIVGRAPRAGSGLPLELRYKSASKLSVV